METDKKQDKHAQQKAVECWAVMRATEKNKAGDGVGFVSDGGQGRSLKVTGRSLTGEGASRPEEDEGGSPHHEFHSRCPHRPPIFLARGNSGR